MTNQAASDAQDRAKHYLLQRAVRAMLCERPWDKMVLSATIESVAKKAKMNLAARPDTEAAKAHVMEVHSLVMEYLVRIGAVEETELQLSGSTPLELRPDWGRKLDVPRLGYTMAIEHRPTLIASMTLLTQLDTKELMAMARRVYAASRVASPALPLV